MAYGTPSTPGDVEAYYTRIRHGRPPSAEQLADLVLRYNAIGGSSPLAQRTADQVEALSRTLDEQAPGQFDVRFGSKYEPPMIEESADSFRDEGLPGWWASRWRPTRRACRPVSTCRAPEKR